MGGTRADSVFPSGIIINNVVVVFRCRSGWSSRVAAMGAGSPSTVWDAYSFLPNHLWERTG